MFFSVKELELKKVRFDVAFSPGEIQYDQGLSQATPLEAVGVRGAAPSHSGRNPDSGTPEGPDAGGL